jgi:hypothetical protein
MSLKAPTARASLVLAAVGAMAVLLVGAIYLAPPASVVRAQSASTSTSCSPNDSSCVYCTNHPTASVCKSTAAPTGQAVTQPASAGSPQATAAAASAAATSQPVTVSAVGQVTAQPTAAPCGPYQSACVYCHNHPTASICKP